MAKKTSKARGRAPSRKSAAAERAAPAEAGEILSSTAEFETLSKGEVTKERRYIFKLYVTGTTARAAQAVASIHAMCDEHLAGRYDLEVIDIYQQPDVAALEQVIAAPTLIKQEPGPIQRLVGDLSDCEKILSSLNIQSQENKTDAPGPTLC